MQKAAYGWRISDWSSDVFSSDLATARRTSGPCIPIHARCIELLAAFAYARWLSACIDLAGKSGPGTGYANYAGNRYSTWRMMLCWPGPDRQGVGQGQSVYGRVKLGGSRNMNKQHNKKQNK